MIFSEKERVGIGTFTPSDPKSQDITELTGSIDLSTIGDVGVEKSQPAETIEGVVDAEQRKAGEVIEDDGSAVDKIVAVLAEAKIL